MVGGTRRGSRRRLGQHFGEECASRHSTDPSECGSCRLSVPRYLDRFAAIPELERMKWEKRVPLEQVLTFEHYNSQWDSRKKVFVAAMRYTGDGSAGLLSSIV